MAEALVSTILEQLDSVKDGAQIVGVDKKILQKLTTSFQGIQAVLKDSETIQLKEKNVRNWFDKLKDISYSVEDVLDECNTWIRKTGDGNTSEPSGKVCSLIPCRFSSCKQVVLPCHIAVKIKNLSRALDGITSEKDKYGFSSTETEDKKQQMTISAVDLPEIKIYGRDHDERKLLNLLLNESQVPIYPMIPIVGMKGSGKTTLAQQVFDCDEVNTHFDKKIWVRVTGLLDEISIAKTILKFLNIKVPNTNNFKTLLGMIKQSLIRVKFLLVLDDVCIVNPKSWNKMKSFLMYGMQGSRILMTIQKKTMNLLGDTNVMLSLERLSDENCWSLFSQVAFPKSNSPKCGQLEEIGRKILSNCYGLPLTIRILGGLLRLKTTTEEWGKVFASKLLKLEDAERGLLSSILLSYCDLPTNLKKCFSYCAIFPKGHKLEKDTLIKLWMVQGYLKVERREDMERIGEEYFNNLAIRSFFYDFERCEHNDKIINCKMPDAVHDIAQFLAQNECCFIEADGPKLFQSQLSYEKVRHLKTINSLVPIFLSKEENLFSLIKYRFKIVVHSKLFERLTCLRTLDLSDCSIEELPRGIKHLIHLRCLNLSHNENLKELPGALCELYNLQTLNISNCSGIQHLPHGIGKLINLLHLINHGTPLSYIPKGVKNLTSLRTLNKFALSDEKDDKSACKLEFLGNLNHLRGFLIITGLGNVGEVDELNKAKLGDKESLLGLGLRFDGLTHVDDEVIFKDFKPPPNLEELMVQYYIGRTMSLDQLMLLKELRVLKLSFCLEFEQLPPLGKLPSLVSLYVSNMKKVKSLGTEFSGREIDGSDTIFPKLRTLEFNSMDAWKKWEDITIMPSLHSLTIAHCEKLEALPDNILKTTTLQKLDIYKCPLLDEHYNKKKEQDWSKISHIPNIKIDGEFVQRDGKYILKVLNQKQQGRQVKPEQPQQSTAKRPLSPWPALEPPQMPLRPPLAPERRQRPLAPPQKPLGPWQALEPPQIPLRPPLAPERRQRPLAPERRQMPLPPERRQGPLAPERRQWPRAPERRQWPPASERRQRPLGPWADIMTTEQTVISTPQEHLGRWVKPEQPPRPVMIRPTKQRKLMGFLKCLLCLN